jgi:hypothetical protein
VFLNNRVHTEQTEYLPALVESASKRLADAKTYAEVLDARNEAALAYDMAKTAARIARAKEAHDELIAVIHRTQASALRIEALAKERLANEYDAAQERGDVAGPRDGRPQAF